MSEVPTNVKLVWPPSEGEIKTIDTNIAPQGNVHLLTPKGFSFYSNGSSAHGGNDELLNPEDLLASSVSSCFFLTFFAIANKARLGLTKYESNVELFLGGDKAKFVEKVVFNLKMKFETPQEKTKVLDICGKAHKYCVIANTLKAELSFNLEID